MSQRRAAATLLGAVVFSTLTIFLVHYQQNQERETMYKGVLRDDERRKEKQRQRQLDLEESRRKRELYESVQTIQQDDSSRTSG